MKTALITGASGNLGQVVCREFLNGGYKVIAISGTKDVTDLFDEKENIEFHKVDLSSEAEVNQLCEEVCGLHESIDVAAFLAGGYAAGAIEESGKNELDAMYKLNFETAYYFSRQIFLKMQQQNYGRMFFVGARPAVDSSAAVKMIPYALSKSSVVKLSELYNAAGKKNNVVASVIIPSIIDTPANRKSNPNADFSKWVSPQKIAQTLLFISSENGEIIREGVFKLYGES